MENDEGAGGAEASATRATGEGRARYAQPQGEGEPAATKRLGLVTQPFRHTTTSEARTAPVRGHREPEVQAFLPTSPKREGRVGHSRERP